MIYSIADVLNPFGKGAAIYNKAMLIELYTKRYYAIKNKIRFGLARDGENYIFHYKIPSEKIDDDGLAYDVIFEFSPGSNEVLNDKTLNNYILNIYCNDPSFTFTYTYVFAKHGILIPWMLDKCMSRCVNERPSEKNPALVVGTNKSMWYAAFHLSRCELLHKNRFQMYVNASKSLIYKLTLSQGAMLAKRLKLERNRAQNPRVSVRKNTREKYEKQKEIEKEIIKYNQSVPEDRRVHPSVSKKIAKEALSAKKGRSARSARSARRPR